MFGKNKSFRWTWRKFREGEKIQAICDYILYGDKVTWKSFNMTDMAFDSDH